MKVCHACLGKVTKSEHFEGEWECEHCYAVLVSEKVLYDMPQDLSPEGLAKELYKAMDHHGEDVEMSHRLADALLVEALRRQGYDQAVDVFLNVVPRWYA